MGIFRVALTGGPCGGKTTCQGKAEKEFGSQILSAPEVASVLLTNLFPSPGKDPAAQERWAHSFQESVLPTQLAMEDQFIEMAQRSASRLLLTDRGALDGAAYLGKGLDYFLNRFGLDLTTVHDRYDMVVHFETVAKSNPELYMKLKATNLARYENAEEAVQIDQALQEVWESHPNWVLIPSKLSVEEKTHKLLSLLNKYLGSEIERKFLIKKLPPNLDEGFEIKQGYFSTESEMRVRKYGNEYFITFKGKGSLERPECERTIPSWVFEDHWDSTYPRHVEKTRHKIPSRHYTMEIDVFKGFEDGPYFLEVEFSSTEEANNFSLPDEEWAHDAIDVTGEKKFTNKYIARYGLHV